MRLTQLRSSFLRLSAIACALVALGVPQATARAAEQTPPPATDQPCIKNGKDGKPDALHPSGKGYEIWATSMQSLLDELMKP